MTETNHIDCADCRGRIREHEPDLVLRKLNGEGLRFFHTRCGAAAQRIVAQSPPDVWRLTIRHVEGEAN